MFLSLPLSWPQAPPLPFTAGTLSNFYGKRERGAELGWKEPTFSLLLGIVAHAIHRGTCALSLSPSLSLLFYFISFATLPGRLWLLLLSLLIYQACTLSSLISFLSLTILLSFFSVGETVIVYFFSLLSPLIYQACTLPHSSASSLSSLLLLLSFSPP